MKRISFGTAVLAALTMAGAGLSAAQEPRPQSGSPASQQPTAGDRGTAASDRDTSNASAFIKDMAEAGMAEVQLGKMAAERASSSEVKEFGQRMVKDHTQANNELKQVASKMSVTLPTTLDQRHQQLADKLAKLEGEQFDQAYMNAMVEGHEQVVSKLQSRVGRQSTANRPSAGERSQPAATAGNEGTGNRPAAAGGGQSVGTSGASQGEAALNQWASKTLPVVQNHLERAKELQKKTAR